MDENERKPAPRDSALRIEQSIVIEPRKGLSKTLYYYSYSGAFVIAEPLPTLAAHLNGSLIEVRPTRLGHPSFRATPQFTNHTFEAHFGAPPTFPVQIASFAAPGAEAGATVNYWQGPAEHLPPNGPTLPADTLTVTAFGQDSGAIGELIESRILRPLLEWIRALTDQWWVGRSYELISGPLHFVAPLDGNDRVIGHPTPVASMTSAGPHMVPLTAKIWTEAGMRAVAGEPAAERGLATDAKYMFVSKEFRSAAILACCAFEAARDRVLSEANLSVKNLPASSTDLLKQLSTGFEKAFGRNISNEDTHLYELLKSFWIARGNAAHGREILWMTQKGAVPIENLPVSQFTDGIDAILGWLLTITPLGHQ